ncbi:MAG: sulfite exporter TauE/SafE family protein [Verrucomicrobia bacterium]|nr:sulfite exporter TauE/SafE family protein [Verrucomicrobiota bacterium]MCF7708478.1 sulfite exporter TauE/SafE family protein [Verrucomicrobiota bacterium]
MQYLLAGLIGLISGVISGLFGVGGGIVIVPALMFFLKVPIKIAIGTSLAIIIPTAIVGMLKHWDQKDVNITLALSIAPTAIAGGYLGAWLTSQLSSGNLRRAFGGFLIIIGLRILLMRSG